MITDKQLKEWRELAEKATPGPWKREGGTPPAVTTAANFRVDTFPAGRKLMSGDNHWGWYVEVCRGNQNTPDWQAEWQDMEFIAASREAVPALLDEVDRLRAELESETKWADEYHREAEKLRAELEAAKAGCVWQLHDDDYCTSECLSCGEEFVFDDGTAEDNGYKFCPHCGKRIERFEKDWETPTA